MTPRGASFELERFSVAPVTADVALLEVEGRIAGTPSRSRAPRLLVEHDDGDRREHAPVEATAQDGQMRVSFAVPAEDAEAPGLALAVGGLLLDLPTPDPVPGADRVVALLRDVNGLRHEASTLRRERTAALEAEAERTAELERQELALVEREAAARSEADERAAAAELAAQERTEAAEAMAQERAEAAELAAQERAEAAEAMAQRHQAAADEIAVERVATAEQAAGERQEELERAATAREGEHERAVEELRRDAAGTHEELEAVRRMLEQREEELRVAIGPRTRAAAPAQEDRVADPDATVAFETEERPVASSPEERPVDVETEERPTVLESDADVDTEERPADPEAQTEAEDEPAEPVASAGPGDGAPDDTGPIPLRRRRRYVAPPQLDARTPRGTAPLPGRDRPRAPADQSSHAAADVTPAAPSTPVASPGPSPRTLALIALAVAGLLLLVVVLGFLL